MWWLGEQDNREGRKARNEEQEWEARICKQGIGKPILVPNTVGWWWNCTGEQLTVDEGEDFDGLVRVGWN